MNQLKYWLIINYLPLPIEQVPTSKFYASVRKANFAGGGFNPQIYITGSAAGGNTCIQGNKAPILVIDDGKTMQVYNDGFSDSTVRFIITGFLVNSLDEYFGLY